MIWTLCWMCAMFLVYIGELRGFFNKPSKSRLLWVLSHVVIIALLGRLLSMQVSFL